MKWAINLSNNMNKLVAKLLCPLNVLRTNLVVFLIFFSITSVLNFNFIIMPPIWDAVAGAFAPAVYLYENDFDFFGLLKQQGYIAGKPNVHSYSLISFLTYLIIYFTNGKPLLYLPILHSIQFIFAGIVLTGTFFMALRLLGLVVACAISVALLFYPLFLVQTGYLYMELPGATLMLCSVLAWIKRYYITSIMLGAAACLVKSFGIVLMFSLILLFFLEPEISKRKKGWLIGFTFFLTIGIEMMKLGAGEGGGGAQGPYLSYFMSIFLKLNLLPDLKVFVITVLVTPLILRLKQLSSKPVSIVESLKKIVGGDFSQRSIIAVYLLPNVFLGFIATVPLAGMYFCPLLRYYTWVLPFLFIGTVYAFKLILLYFFQNNSNDWSKNIDAVLVILIVSLSCFFVVNRNGQYYPSLDSDINSFSSAERSYEYLDFYKIQYDSVASLAELQRGLPAFVTRGEYYYLSSPLMGYVKKPLKNILFILKSPYNRANLTDFPDEFLLLDVPSQKMHGISVLRKILADAKADSNYSISELVQHQVGPYKSVLYHIYKIK